MRSTWLLLALMLVLAVPMEALAQTGAEGIVYVPGHPLTMWVPDPDAVQWEGRQDRPGYRYRGMAPLQQRFYDYIQQKRAEGRELSWADRMMIAQLQSSRRWPEAPIPDEFWRSYMRELRSRETDDLTFADRCMLAQLVSRGYLPADPPPDAGIQRIIDLVQTSGARTPRNWFERSFGRVNDWLSHTLVSCGYDVGDRVTGPGPGVFPATPFNGMQIRYNLSGASLGAPSDSEGFTTGRYYEGTFTPGTPLTFTGTASMSAGFGASVAVGLIAGGERQEDHFHLKSPGDGTAATQDFLLTLVVPADAETGWFGVDMTGSYNAGERGLTVSGNLYLTNAERAARREAADAEWRAEVERTLRELGYEDTPEGKLLGEMRAALAAGDEAFKEWSDAQLRAHESQPDPEVPGFEELRTALEAGGDAWEEYAQNKGAAPDDTAEGTRPPTTGDVAPPAADPYSDLGGLRVGTSTANGVVEGAGERFGPVPSLSTAWKFEGLPEGTVCEAVWSRDGEELARSSREVGGSGWVSFQISGGGGNLPPGDYTVTLTAGGQVVGRKSFRVAP